MENLKTAIYCQAIGDALGWPFEFVDPSPEEVRDFVHCMDAIEYTDDTQLTLATLVGLTDENPIYGVKHEYMDWFAYQGLKSGPGLSKFEDYRARRAPGVNTYKVLWERVNDNQSLRIGDSSGNGTIMRSLPYVFYGKEKGYSAAYSLAQEHAIYTHGGNEIFLATDMYLEYATRGNFYPIESKYLRTGGRTAIDCTVLAIIAVESSHTFEDCMVKCIAHEGDSDTIAAVAGGLWALRRGKPKYFDRYVARLQGKDAIEYALEQWETRYGKV